jgi:iodotyrosine deiodinase
MYNAEKPTYRALALPDRVQKDSYFVLKEANQFLAYMRKRHSVRDYSSKKVSENIIASAISAAGTAPSGANHQPWHFVAISNPEMKAEIRKAAEEEERTFYSGGGGDEWISALEPIGTGASKPHLTDAPWLIVIFAQRYGVTKSGKRYKNYYVPESVGIATGILITALHHAGLVCLEHTPNPMKFLTAMCMRPAHEKPVMILPVGYPSDDASVPEAAKIKKPLSEIMTVF